VGVFAGMSFTASVDGPYISASQIRFASFTGHADVLCVGDYTLPCLPVEVSLQRSPRPTLSSKAATTVHSKSQVLRGRGEERKWMDWLAYGGEDVNDSNVTAMRTFRRGYM